MSVINPSTSLNMIGGSFHTDIPQTPTNKLNLKNAKTETISYKIFQEPVLDSPHSKQFVKSRVSSTSPLKSKIDAVLNEDYSDFNRLKDGKEDAFINNNLLNDPEDSDFEQLKNGSDDEDGINSEIGVKKSDSQEDIIENLMANHFSENSNIEDALQALSSLIKAYNHYKKSILKHEKSFQIQILNKCKYLSENDVNILEGIRKFAPEYYKDAVNWLDKGDVTYKWTDCIVPLIAQSTHYGLIYYNQKQLQKHLKKYQELLEDKNQFSSSENAILKTLKQKLDLFSEELNKDKQLASDEGIVNFVKLLSKAPSVIHLKNVEAIPEKASGKICKFIFKFFKNLWVLGNIKNSLVYQQECLFDLKPRIKVYINSNPSAKARKLKTKQKHIAEINKFINALNHCKTMDQVKEKFDKLEFPFKIPVTINDPKDLTKNLRFMRQIIRACLFWRSIPDTFMEPVEINELLHKRKQEHDSKVGSALMLMIQHIQQCEAQSWSEIKKHFASLHIDLETIDLSDKKNPDKIPYPPQSKDDWEACIHNPEFCMALAEKWVQYQETVAILSTQALTQFLLSKHEVERKSLLFRTFTNILSLFSNAIQLSLCHPKVQSFVFRSTLRKTMLEWTFNDLNKLGITGAGLLYFFYPLYPHITLKIEALLMLLVNHCYYVRIKPHEYSYKSYKMTLEMNILECILTLRSFILKIRSLMLWFNINVIENRMLGMKRDLPTDPRHVAMMYQYQEKYLDCQTRIKKLKRILKNFKIEDAKRIVKSSSKLSSSNPFKDLADLIKSADIDYFPPHLLEVFENHIIDYSGETSTSFKLTNDSKKNLQVYLEELFSESDFTFIKAYDANRFAYLKA